MVPGPWPTCAGCSGWEGADTEGAGAGHSLAGRRWDSGHAGRDSGLLHASPSTSGCSQRRAGSSIHRVAGAARSQDRGTVPRPHGRAATQPGPSGDPPSAWRGPSGLHGVSESGLGHVGVSDPKGGSRQQEGTGRREVGVLYPLRNGDLSSSSPTPSGPGLLPVLCSAKERELRVPAPGTHLQGQTLSTRPHPLPTVSDKPCSSSRLSPRDLHPQALPTKLQPHMEGTLLSTGHQHVGSRSRILLGQIPASLY